MKDDGIVEEIKSRLDIVEILSDYISLRKAGQNYKANCPFHSEKTPSFVVSPQKQIFHCFGCGAGGDIFGFVMKYENLSFPETLRILAKKAGVTIESYDPKQASEKDALREIQKTALKYFIDELSKSKSASEYLLEKRGLDSETIEKFSLGFAPAGWHNIFELLKKKGFSETLIIRSGLVSSGTKGPYDVFRDRIMFPIKDIHGEVIAFGGRVMDDSQPKYLNSPDTPLFKKGDTLYALDASTEEIKKTEFVMVVEGYLDAIVCHRFGFQNTVAPLGTALTTGHLRLLSRYTRQLLLVFDGDSAGINAARRSLLLIAESGLRGKVLLLPEGQDPDSLLRQEGPEAFKILRRNKSTLVDFLLKTSKAGKTETVNEALAHIAKIGDPVYRDELLIELSDRTRVAEASLRDKLKRILKPYGRVETVSESGGGDEEMLLLAIVLYCPEKRDMIFGRVSLDEFKGSEAKFIISKALESGSSEDLIASLEDESQKSLVRRLLIEPGFDPDNVDDIADGCIKKIRERRLNAEIGDAEASGDLKLLSRLLAERKKIAGGMN